MNARTFGILILTAIVLLVSGAETAQAGPISPGIGIHYLRNLGDISEAEGVDLNQNSTSLLGSLKMDAGPLKA
ncbi:MAG TPA: hypothetical protein VFS09_09400, partial [Candidatus Eisenbacteria bacterium]|nr:hypothetical protein [Candidatus Eisenbacteria bacterium]